jgi:hypothetical protein
MIKVRRNRKLMALPNGTSDSVIRFWGTEEVVNGGRAEVEEMNLLC